MQKENVRWRMYQSILIPDIPPHHEVNPSPKTIKRLFRTYKPLLIRWTNNWDLQDSTKFWYIIKDTPEELSTFSKNTRSKVNRGLKRNTIIKVNAEYIAKNGYEVYKEAFKRYNTFLKPLDKKGFFEMLEAKPNNKTMHYWAIISKKEQTLVGFSINILQEETVNYSIIKFHPQYLKDYISYALIHKMNEYYLNGKELLYVNDGARSISHETNIQDFLTSKFHFRKAYCKLNIRYRWDIKIIINLLFPFRRLISRINTILVKKIVILLQQEEIRRTIDG